MGVSRDEARPPQSGGALECRETGLGVEKSSSIISIHESGYLAVSTAVFACCAKSADDAWFS